MSSAKSVNMEDSYVGQLVSLRNGRSAFMVKNAFNIDKPNHKWSYRLDEGTVLSVDINGYHLTGGNSGSYYDVIEFLITKHVSSSHIVDKDIILDRKNTYGNNFPIINSLWNTYLEKRFPSLDIALTEEDTAMMMALMKVSRLAKSPDNKDSMVDLINYMWIGLNYQEYLNFEATPK